MNRTNWMLVAGLLVVPVILRVATHYSEAMPNIECAAAVALFCGAVFTNWRIMFGVPLVGMLVSDVLINEWDGSRISVYTSLAGAVLLGSLLRHRMSRPIPVLGVTLTSSLLFFVLTNFQYWVSSTPALGIYHTPHTVAGLIQAYVQAMPFFRATLLGDLLYSGLLFGAYALVASRVPQSLPETVDAVS